jgi:hypothetical protein
MRQAGVPYISQPDSEALEPLTNEQWSIGKDIT